MVVEAREVDPRDQEWAVDNPRYRVYFWAQRDGGWATTITVAELCTARLWQRVQGGYEILERGLVEMAADQFRIEEERRKACEDTGGHEPHQDASWLCRKCGDRVS
jgi:hypothetical protein